MKKLLYISFLTTLLLTGCSEDFLERVPESSVTSGNFYQTEAQFEQAMVGAYAAVRDAKGSIAAWCMGEMRSDNTHLEFNNTNRGPAYIEREYTDFFLDDVTSTLVADKYNRCYVGIARANSIIDYLPGAGLSQQVADRLTGQARFLRALFYFDLVRYFGGVPLYLKAVSGAGDAYLPRSSVDEVYKVIVDDLKDAIAKLPAPAFPQTGRATQAAAKMLLADVYLTQKNFALAETELKGITPMGFALLPDYASVFSLSNKNSRESLFEIQYQQGNQGQNSNFLYPFLPLASDVSKITGITSQNRQGGGWNVPTFEMIGTYEPGDKRLEASIGIAEGTGVVGDMAIESLKSPVGYVKPAGKRAYPYIKKYLHPHSLEQNTDDNFPVYRYSDVLLGLAEALNEQNKGAEALTYLNPVRVRAGLAPSTQTSQAALRDLIAHERRVEFAFENKRWLDLVRTGKAIEVMNKNGEYIKAFHAGESYLPGTSYAVTQNRLLFPIPNREILIGKLQQNPGY
ncbi:RagB/SusD family nutrient uptake outer membrane protein [Larkinella sp.]|uniref:RagB/SusD family nutrient uptake outer membrane protein n=1 Tax=Larkinella sp. TaxID=2034517 RepID=UPI003BAD9070